MTTETASPLLSVNQVGQRLGVTAETVRRLVRTQGLPAVRIGTKDLRVHEAELALWLERQRVP